MEAATQRLSGQGASGQVRQNKQHSGIARVVRGGGHRFVTDHTHSAFEKLARRWVMHVIGDDDGLRLNPVSKPRLAFCHFQTIVISAIVFKTQIGGNGL